MLQRTANFSRTATRTRLCPDVAGPSLVLEGAELAGLGSSDDEWEAAAATLPPDLRPSVHGGWSPALERAVIAQRRAKRAADAALAPPVFAPIVMTPAERRTWILGVMQPGQFYTVKQLAAALQQRDYSTYLALDALRRAGKVRGEWAVGNRSRVRRYVRVEAES